MQGASGGRTAGLSSLNGSHDSPRGPEQAGRADHRRPGLLPARTGPGALLLRTANRSAHTPPVLTAVSARR